MATTTASSVDNPSDNDLPLSAHLTEPAGPAIDTSESPVTPDTSAQSVAHRLGERGVVCGILLQTAVPSYLKCHPFWCTAYYWALSYSSG